MPWLAQITPQLIHLDGLLPGVLFEWAEEQDGRRGFKWIGHNAAQHCGVPRVRLLGGWDALPLHPDDRSAFSEQLTRAVADRAEWSFRGRFIDDAGAPRWWRANARWVEDDGQTVRFLGQLFDIDADVRRADATAAETEHLRRAIERSEERFDLAIGASNEGVFDWDVRTESIYYSPAVGRMFGCTVEMLPRSLRHWHRRLDQRGGRDLVHALVAQLRSQASRFGTVVSIPMPHGPRLSLEVNARVLYDDAGRARRLVGTVSDVTARVESERHLIKAMDEADAANRAKSDFLARMSHELRTPLNSIIGFGNLLQKKLEGRLQPGERDQLARVARNGLHLLDLINDILDLSKIEAGRVELEVQPVDLRDLVEQTVAELEGSIGTRPLRLVVECPDGRMWIDTDRGKMRQVLVNLIGNALKFTSQGTVRVRVHQRVDGSAAWIDVIDPGIGIDQEQLDRIFTPFEQAEASTSRRFGGTGLGLSIVRKLMRMLGGDVTVASAPGVGSTFRVHFTGDPAESATMPSIERAA
jgi:PAS domain S-box-containing protein